MFINEQASWIFRFEKFMYVSGASLIDSFCRDTEWKIDRPFLWTDNISIFGGKGRGERIPLCKGLKESYECFFTSSLNGYSPCDFSTNLEMDLWAVLDDPIYLKIFYQFWYMYTNDGIFLKNIFSHSSLNIHPW